MSADRFDFSNKHQPVIGASSMPRGLQKPFLIKSLFQNTDEFCCFVVYLNTPARRPELLLRPELLHHPNPVIFFEPWPSNNRIVDDIAEFFVIFLLVTYNPVKIFALPDIALTSLNLTQLVG